MPRIRVGFVGLSTGSTSTNWAARAHLPYLQSPLGQAHYEIVALCNSSVASAKKSIEHYKLPASTKTYASPAELAADPDVDLVVNVTGVQHHHGVLLPVVQAGKNVFTELPLASNMDQMRELMAAAREKKVSTVFGMQGQTATTTKLLRDTIAQGKIGKVLSSSWVGAGGSMGEKPLPVAFKMFLERKVGANIMTVAFLHTINHVLSVLGELSTYNSILGTQRQSYTIIDPSQDNKVLETATTDTPDHVLLQGQLTSGALLTYHLRGGDAFPGTPALEWTIYGEKGILRITAPFAMFDIMHEGAKIELQVFGEDKVQELEIPKDKGEGGHVLADLAHPGRNVGAIYEAYATGRKGGEGGYPDWEVGFKRHLLIAEMWEKSEGETPYGEKAPTETA